MDNIIICQGISIQDLLRKIDEIVEQRISEKLQHLQPRAKTDYLSRSEVAELLKITLPTLHDWTKLGWLRSYKIGNRVLYKKNEIEESLERVMFNKHKKGL